MHDKFLPPLQDLQPATRLQFRPGAFPKFSHLRNNDAFEHERQTPNAKRLVKAGRGVDAFQGRKLSALAES
jgi:hypothetical protein